ncbi:PilZ domain-containing protein [Alginatibacterium sediminis]|uniref:PilZ domain-containing protein n=1 Tax=Alginatibacterium sediminis TaxID=2164068 RepID=A0A420EAS1_9ALTE|nr:PilZ domain-containing protein [Alginatibacterium sediminis]RKF17770.1 PilZ domain-containing protein [Alginatibacterium sediminis]
MTNRDALKRVPNNITLGVNVTTRYKQEVEFEARWIGCDETDFIILRITGLKSESGLNLVSAGCPVRVRVNINGKLLAFSSEISSLLNEPKRWMIIKYPIDLMEMPLRKQTRFESYMYATLHLDSKYVIKGILKDLSLKGCKFVPSGVEKFNINLLKKKTLQLQTRFPEHQEDTIIKIQVRNTPKDRKEFALGLMFMGDTSVVRQQIKRQLVNQSVLEAEKD